MARHLTIAVTTTIGTAVMALLPVTSARAAGSEFDSPSQSQLPAPTAYNTTPNCPVSAVGSFCMWSSTPPLDPANTENVGTNTWSVNCAYWAAEKRPDILVNAIWKYGYPASPGGAADWYGDAVQAGYPVTHTPTVGAIEVTVPPQGSHVEYVEQVFTDGSYIVSSANFNSGGATYWAPASDATTRWFIALKPGAGGSPTPTPVTPALTSFAMTWGGHAGTSKVWTTDRVGVPRVPAGATVKYRWYVGGKLVGAHPSLRMSGGWLHRSVYATVTVSLTGYASHVKKYLFRAVN